MAYNTKNTKEFSEDSLVCKQDALILSLKDSLKGILIGLLLGDATLYQTKKGNTSLKLECSYGQKDFVEHVHEILHPWCKIKEPGIYIKKYWVKAFYA